MKILYICTHNRCRSILCEGLTNHFGRGILRAASAGSQPAGKVHSLTIKYLDEKKVPTQGLRSKSWDELETFAPDVVVTVCDSAANETCPIWMGDTLKLHWGLKDPSKIEGSGGAIDDAFRSVIATIEQRIGALLAVANSDFSPRKQAEALKSLQT